jgi:DNA-binding protein HU-beta
MTKDELATEISKKTGVEKVIVVKTIEALMKSVKDNMSKNENIYLRGFGTFEVKKRKEKAARNISKNTAVIIPEHFIPYFKPAKEFKDEVRNKKK